jgi:hypothetical protein
LPRNSRKVLSCASVNACLLTDIAQHANEQDSAGCAFAQTSPQTRKRIFSNRPSKDAQTHIGFKPPAHPVRQERGQMRVIGVER